MRNERESGLKFVKVKRKQLVEKLKANRETHKAEFKEAWEGYVQTVIDTAKENLRDAKKWSKEPSEAHHFDSAPSAPKNHTKEYDRAIALLEWEVEDEVELSTNDFNCYVLDDWSWKRDHAMSMSSYANKSY